MNRSKIRPDVLETMDTLLRYQMEGVFKFLQREENQGVDFQALWNKVIELNERFFRGEFQKRENLYGLLTDEEMLASEKVFQDHPKPQLLKSL